MVIHGRIELRRIKLNVHVILKSDTIDLLTSWFEEAPEWFSYINAVIVLNYKPIGGFPGLTTRDGERLKAFYESAAVCKSVKIGFDSCCVPGIVTWMNAKPALIDSCEAARFSAFVSEDMKMYPCSFMVNTEQYGDLRKESLLDIWRSHPAFVNHRESILYNSCTGCKHRAVCNGGCVFMPEINQCSSGGGIGGGWHRARGGQEAAEEGCAAVHRPHGATVAAETRR